MAFVARSRRRMQSDPVIGKSMKSSRVLFALVLAGGILAYVGVTRGVLPAAAPSSAKEAPARIPVMAAAARRTDVPIFLTGLGTVQAFNSVLIKSRVDGQIVKIDFSEGSDVHVGDLLVEIDPAPFEAALAQAQATKLKDQAQLDNARLDFGRFSRLTATGAATAQQADASRALVAQLDANIKADQAMIDLAQVQLEYSRIRSPIEGRVGTRLVDIGNVVRAQDTGGIVVVNQIRPIFVSFALPAASLPQIRARLPNGAIGVTAQDGTGKDLTSGKLTVIDNQINPATATINYKATFDNAGEPLWPGQFVNVRVQIDIRRNVVAAPVTAVQYAQDGAYVFVIGPDHVVQKRAIKVGAFDKTTAVIDDGLHPGEQVVIDGQYRIQAGSTVDVIDQQPEARG
jgi:membrane fusion protein, multidrug efflux system